MKKMLWRFTGWILLAAVAHVAQAASDRASTEQVAAQLVASVAAVHPGSEIYLGLHQQIIPHWHTYWVNPGDSGNATTIDWSLPEGATASEIYWPIPSRFSLGPITNYGYENSVTLLTKISVPAQLQPGDQFTAAALVDWLVCEEECIPQQVALELSLPVVGSSESTGQGSPLIEQALAQLPVASPYKISAHQAQVDATSGQTQLRLTLGLPAAQIPQVSDIWFYPYDWGRIQQSAPQRVTTTSQGLELVIEEGEAPLSPGQSLTGVLVIQEQVQVEGSSTPTPAIIRGFEINTPLLAATTADVADSLPGFFSALLLALIGGIILNLMPCVFPVLSIKALSLISHAHQSPAQIRLHGAAYTLGVLASFALLALVLILLKAGGAQIGWGFQFQSPLFVIAVAYLMFAVGLSLSGVFYIGGSVAGVGASLAEKPGYGGSFFTGVLATIVATPCTAPFMAAALGYALAQPPLMLLAVFLSLGLGLALPYLLLTCWPRLQRWLPRPGAWMERMKQLLAFPMYAAAIWLVWVLVQQAGLDALVIVLGGMLLLALAAWIYDSSRYASTGWRRLGSCSAVLLIAGVLVMSFIRIDGSHTSSTQASTSAAQHWEPFSEARLNALRADNKPVFVNFTAAWCISCLVNEKVALSDQGVIDAFNRAGITYLKGDWTNRDPEITAFLKRFNRSGVPLYLFYPESGSAPRELPQILTPDMVIAAIEQPH
ncbi:protein-disulfide reductase DsbD [Cellvibrio sp. PSBB023]|uniref:protein-disulfide reductase DsbD family protein n=1 Tax=Cellvibrio sp. PSBB023 TaxID=1945512 RepID=UPI00098FB483|nr:thioredoxin family protein [Cellvibrio sp. PSBB023]AQT59410.1 thiol:disulfide interchange protein [Cellvibrio sp. PSBB023]